MVAWPALGLAMAALACSGKPAARPRHDGGDAGSAPRVDAAVAVAPAPSGPPDGAGPGYQLAAVAGDGAVVGSGALAVTVTWPGAPPAVRASPGVDGCGRPRPPRAAVAALHGVAGVAVWLDGLTAGKAPPPARPVRLTARDCALTPAVAVVPRLGATLEVQSQDDSEHALAITELGAPWATELPASVAVTRARLPVWGHTVSLPLAGAGVRRVVDDRAADEPAWVVVTAHPYAAVTDGDGAALLEQVPAGTHAVVAWLPPAAGQPPVLLRGTATVVAGEKAELTLQVTP